MALKEKPYNGGQWTQARFNSFIKSALRSASNRWGPKHEAKKAARVSRGVYMCAGYNSPPHETPASLPPLPGNKKRRQVAIDHIEPVIDPAEGFVSWDKVISRMYCEVDGFQLLCPEHHAEKTKEERARRCK